MTEHEAAATPIRQRLGRHDPDQQCSVQHGSLTAPYKSQRTAKPSDLQCSRNALLKLEDLTRLTGGDCDELMQASSALEPLQKLDLLKQLDQLTATLQSAIDAKHQTVTQMDDTLKSLKDSIRSRNTQMTVELQRLKERVSWQSEQFELGTVTRQLEQCEHSHDRDELKIKQMQQLAGVLDSEEAAVEAGELDRAMARQGETERKVTAADISTPFPSESRSLILLNVVLMIIICFIVPFYLPHLVVSMHAPNVYAAK